MHEFTHRSKQAKVGFITVFKCYIFGNNLMLSHNDLLKIPNC